jgi:RNA polymerase sigma factor (sigma-70 family)
MSESALALVQELADETETPSHVAAVNERGHALQVSIARLPDDQQQAVRLYSLQQRSLAEVAEAMGRSPDSVRGLLHRAKQALREHMGKSSMWFSRR